VQVEDQSSLHVEVKSNVAERKSEILRLTPPVGIAYRIPLFDFYITPLKFNKVGGDQITDRQTKLWLMVRKGSQETLEELTCFDYLKWIELSIAQQYNINFRANLQVTFPDRTPLGKVRVVPGDILIMEMLSDDVVSWAAGDGSQIYFKVIEERLAV